MDEPAECVPGRGDEQEDRIAAAILVGATCELYADQIMSASHKLKGIGFKVDDAWLAV